MAHRSKKLGFHLLPGFCRNAQGCLFFGKFRKMCVRVPQLSENPCLFTVERENFPEAQHPGDKHQEQNKSRAPPVLGILGVYETGLHISDQSPDRTGNIHADPDFVDLVICQRDVAMRRDLVPRAVRANFDQVVPLAVNEREIVAWILVGLDQGLQNIGKETDEKDTIQLRATSPRRHNIEMVVVGLRMDDGLVTPIVRVIGKRGDIRLDIRLALASYKPLQIVDQILPIPVSQRESEVAGKPAPQALVDTGPEILVADIVSVGGEQILIVIGKGLNEALTPDNELLDRVGCFPGLGNQDLSVPVLVIRILQSSEVERRTGDKQYRHHDKNNRRPGPASTAINRRFIMIFFHERAITA